MLMGCVLRGPRCLRRRWPRTNGSLLLAALLPAVKSFPVAITRNLGTRPRSPNAFVGIDLARRRLAAGTAENSNLGRKNAQKYSSKEDHRGSRSVTNVAIIGGGLAGMSTAYHLLDLVGNGSAAPAAEIHITIYDKANIGEGGASAVAGGLIHPFSPRGKLIHFGLTALDHSNDLIQMASKHRPQCIVRPHLYRVALDSEHVIQLQRMVKHFPTLATWISEEYLYENFGLESFGGAKLANGCKVIHVPSYLRGLWEECEIKADETNGSIKWELIKLQGDEWRSILEHLCSEQNGTGLSSSRMARHDAVILSAGAGILEDNLLDGEESLPVQLVRGQSLEMSHPKLGCISPGARAANEAFLCGKYVSPLPSGADDSSPKRFVIGATHEHKTDALVLGEVLDELKGRAFRLAPHLWKGGQVDRLTTGVRMQSRRGRFGRLPIIGRYNGKGEENLICHDNLWLFTGLSSRGLIYHALFARWLADAVLHDDEKRLRDQFEEFDWWK